MEEAGTARQIVSAVILTADAAALLFFLAAAMGLSSRKQFPMPDGILQKYRDEICAFLPCGIPASASDVTWRYIRQESFPSSEFTITLSMYLPENEYRAVKKKILEEADRSEGRKGKRLKVTISHAGGSRPEMTIHFDDDRYWLELVRHFGGNDASDWNLRR